MRSVRSRFDARWAPVLLAAWLAVGAGASGGSTATRSETGASRGEGPRLLHAPPPTAGHRGADSREWVGYDLRTGQTVQGTVSPAETGAIRHPGRLGTAVRPTSGRGSGAELQRVFGPDNRRHVSDTTAYPYSTMCRLLVRYPNGNAYLCTGTMVGPSHVLTAGHCLYDQRDGGWPEEVEVTPGQQGLLRPFGTTRGRFLRVFRGWIERESFDDDVGLITLELSLGELTGWLGFGHFSQLRGVHCRLNAYSGDVGDGNEPWHARGPVLRQTRHQLHYRLDTFPGSSGGGIYRLWRDEPVIVGVNSWQSPHYNGACRLNRSKAAALTQFIAEDE